MSDWSLAAIDGNVQKWFRYNHETGEHEWKLTEDASKLTDLTKKARNNESGNWKGDQHHVASIPSTIWLAWWKELGENPGLPHNREWLKKKLNDPDNAYFRVKSGRI